MTFTINTLIKHFLGYGSMRSQWLFEKLYLQSIRGMNYGSPHFWENGELKVMHYVDLRLSQCGKKHPVLFDIGANNGDYTRNLYRVFGRNASIHCFEPSTASFKILQKKIIDIDNIAAYPFCLGDAEETCTLFYDESTSTIASLHDLPINHPWKGYKSEQVQVKTLDSLCPQINVNEINFLKIDVEGHELAVLHGAQEMICNQKIDYIQFEFGFRQIDSRTYFRDFYNLLNENYRLYRILKDNLFPIDYYHEGLEVFVGVGNFLAENRLLGEKT